jgi:hypothetical protein
MTIEDTFYIEDHCQEKYLHEAAALNALLEPLLSLSTKLATE